MAGDPRVDHGSVQVLLSEEADPRVNHMSVEVLWGTSASPFVNHAGIEVLGRRKGRRVLAIIGAPDANFG